MDVSCLFCLESVSDPFKNPIGCSCQIDAHEACMQKWYQEKQQLECPICHTISIQNPLPIVHIVYMQDPVIYQRERQERMQTQRCMGFFCLSLILMAIVINSLSATIWKT